MLGVFTDFVNFAFLFEIHFLILFRCDRDRSNLFLFFPPTIIEVESKIDFEEKMDFGLKKGFVDGVRSKSESNQ